MPAGLRWQLFVERSSVGAAALLPGHEPRLPDGDGVVRSFAVTAGFAR